MSPSSNAFGNNAGKRLHPLGGWPAPKRLRVIDKLVKI
jgi:hypothetical protein